MCLCVRRCRNIFVLQQNLTNITMSREVDLDRARQYFELLFLSGEVRMRLMESFMWSKNFYFCNI